VKDDGDLLQFVLDHALVYNAIFAYNDGSRDNTEDILKNHPKISKYVNREDFSIEERQKYPQHRRHHLLQMVMDEYSTYNTEDIWIVRMEGDRIPMNHDPQDICNRAAFNGHVAAAGVMVDCRIGPNEEWPKLDSYPNWHKPISIIQNWARVDDVHPIVAFKVEDGIRYSVTKPRPWPVVLGSSSYIEGDLVHKDMPFFAHHGRRGPRYWNHAFGPGGTRRPSRKWPAEWNFNTPDKANETVTGIPFKPNWLHRLRCVATEYELELHHPPYGGEYLQNDITTLIEQWNHTPPRKK